MSAPAAFVYIPGLHGDPRLFAFLEQPLRMLGFKPLHTDHIHQAWPEVTLNVLVEQVRALLDAEGIEQAIIGGESFGSLVAQSFARTYPERTAALALFGGFSQMPGNTLQTVLTRTPIIRDIAKHLPPFVTNLNRRHGAKSYDPTDPVALQATFDSIYVPHTRPYWEKGRIALDFDSHSWLSELTMPALAMTGEHDAVVPPRYTEELGKLLPNATTHIIPNTGHLAQFARPDIFIEHLRAFCLAHSLLPEQVALV